MAEDKLTRSEVVVRWCLGFFCLALEVVIVGIVLAAVKRNLDPSELFFWHPTLMTVGSILCLSHGTSLSSPVGQVHFPLAISYPVLFLRE
jgi:hypothetical protein